MKIQKGDTISLTARSMGSGGEGIAKVDDFVIFVDGALPGEESLAEITLVKKSYAKARVVDIKKPSPNRVVPPCPVFGVCGGCQLQHMSYEAQLEVKKQRVIDSLERIGGLEGVVVSDCVPSQKHYAYRNKIQLPVIYSEKGIQLGLYARRTHDIVPVDGCLIHCELGEKVFNQVKKLTPPHKGKIRYLLIKSAVRKNEALVVLVTTGLDEKWLKEFASKLDVKGVVENINTREDNIILGDKFNLISGSPYIEEEICGKIFRVSPHSFFQVNTDQAELIYRKVLELADLDKTKTFVDAYCGVGTVSLIASDIAKQVYGIECVGLAVSDAKENAQLNNVENATFIHGVAEEEVKKIKNADVVFLNPPRKGCNEELLHAINAKTIIYMSCNPATLARDLKILSNRYKVETVIPYDMFPQTTHVETLVKIRAI